jgi:ligand-binding SRPBCC domain-containing protein
MARIHLETLIAADPATVFDLAVDVDVHMASTVPSNERAVAGVVSGRMALHSEVTWQARHFGLPWRMTSRITEYERPHRFVDEMRSGPFRRWRHEHRFDLVAGGTRMVDDVDYAAPLGPLGLLVERAVLHRYMTELLRSRNAHIKELGEASR